ncbi:MAG: MOSC domain-containing protein [Sulfitobacter sp.]|nr:MOSC domain-containing protein [Sulfitobacter sp.]
MIARWAQPGEVTGLWLRSERRALPRAVESARIGEDGLKGDHGRAGKRAVTLMHAEHLPVIGAALGRGPVDPALLRRNILVAGLNLSALKGRQVRLGGAVLEITGICAPCSRMEEAFGYGGYSAVRGHGGWCARVVEPGDVALGDGVTPLDDG